jgi:hypothetical protein
MPIKKVGSSRYWYSHVAVRQRPNPKKYTVYVILCRTLCPLQNRLHFTVGNHMPESAPCLWWTNTSKQQHRVFTNIYSTLQDSALNRILDTYAMAFIGSMPPPPNYHSTFLVFLLSVTQINYEKECRKHVLESKFYSARQVSVSFTSSRRRSSSCGPVFVPSCPPRLPLVIRIQK